MRTQYLSRTLQPREAEQDFTDFALIAGAEQCTYVQASSVHGPPKASCHSFQNFQQLNRCTN